MHFCSKWHLIVNISKTKVMRIGTNKKISFIYDKQVIENVDSFKYLGHIIDSNKQTHRKMPEYLIAQAQKALFALNNKKKSSLGYLQPVLAIKMFDSYILPILEYNSMLWSRTKMIDEIERVQLGYLKKMLGVRRQTPTLAIYAETGRFPLFIRQKITCLNYWAKLENLPDSDILHKCLKIQKTLHSKGLNNWYSKIVQFINESKIPRWENINPTTLVSKVKIALYDQEQVKIFSEINDSDSNPKLRTYKLFKLSYCLEPYLNSTLSRKTFTNLARFRLSSHNLKIETGRHEKPKVPPENRICTKCNSNEIEDEMHCLLSCNSNNSARNILFSRICPKIVNFSNLSKKSQFVVILSNKDPEIMHALGEFLNESFST